MSGNTSFMSARQSWVENQLRHLHNFKDKNMPSRYDHTLQRLVEVASDDVRVFNEVVASNRCSIAWAQAHILVKTKEQRVTMRPTKTGDSSCIGYVLSRDNVALGFVECSLLIEYLFCLEDLRGIRCVCRNFREFIPVTPLLVKGVADAVFVARKLLTVRLCYGGLLCPKNMLRLIDHETITLHRQTDLVECLVLALLTSERSVSINVVSSNFKRYDTVRETGTLGEEMSFVGQVTCIGRAFWRTDFEAIFESAVQSNLDQVTIQIWRLAAVVHRTFFL